MSSLRVVRVLLSFIRFPREKVAMYAKDSLKFLLTHYGRVDVAASFTLGNELVVLRTSRSPRKI